MFFHFSILLYSLLYALSLELIISFPMLTFMWVVFLVYLAVAAAKRTGKRWMSAIIPVIFVLVSANLLYLISFSAQRHVFIVLSSGMFYLLLLSFYRLRQSPEDQTARGILASVLMATIFFSYASVYGFYLNFNIRLWFLAMAYVAITAFSSYQFLVLSGKGRRRAALYSLVIGLSMGELSIMINFWPFGYLTTGVTALFFYYLLWDLAQSHLFSTLSRRRLAINLLTFTILTAIVLTSSRWVPIV